MDNRLDSRSHVNGHKKLMHNVTGVKNRGYKLKIGVKNKRTDILLFLQPTKLGTVSIILL
jgi:hypothetical protein